jgi:hypothetical protein
MKGAVGGHDWDELVDRLLEVVDGIHGVMVIAVVGALVGLGAAPLVNVPKWIGVGIGALMLPLAVVLLARAAAREDDR